MLHLKISSQRRVPLESLLSSSAMILMKGRSRANASFELNTVLQNELNMTRWDAKTHLINRLGGCNPQFRLLVGSSNSGLYQGLRAGAVYAAGYGGVPENQEAA